MQTPESPERSIQDPTATAPTTVLLVNAQHAALNRLAATLSGQGYRVRTATSSEAAFDIFLRERPDILIVDDEIIKAHGEDLVRCARVLDGRLAIILQCGTLEPHERRRFVRDLQLHGLHDRHEDTGRLLELLESAVANLQRVDDARAGVELRSLVLTKFCHDLRASLHVIRGYAEVLSADPAAASVAEILERLGVAADTALGLAQDYLELARVDAPGVVVRREAVDVDALFADLQSLGARQIGPRAVRLITDVPFSGSFICTDGEKLRAILVQLVANATKFTLSGEIRLALRAEPNRTHFLVADTGPGLNRHELQSVVRPFRQRRDEAATLPGEGVGLAIAVRLSALLGAALTVNALESAGAIFTLSLPVGLSYRHDGSEPTLH